MFQTACKKLPLALRDWAAYKDCRKTIDDFLELLPLFQALTHRAVHERCVYWGSSAVTAVAWSCCCLLPLCSNPLTNSPSPPSHAGTGAS